MNYFMGNNNTQLIEADMETQAVFNTVFLETTDHFSMNIEKPELRFLSESLRKKIGASFVYLPQGFQISPEEKTNTPIIACSKPISSEKKVSLISAKISLAHEIGHYALASIGGSWTGNDYSYKDLPDLISFFLVDEGVATIFRDEYFQVLQQQKGFVDRLQSKLLVQCMNTLGRVSYMAYMLLESQIHEDTKPQDFQSPLFHFSGVNFFGNAKKIVETALEKSRGSMADILMSPEYLHKSARSTAESYTRFLLRHIKSCLKKHNISEEDLFEMVYNFHSSR